MDLLAVSTALGAAILFGLSNHIQRIGLATTDDLTGTLVSVATMAGLFWLLAPFAIDPAAWGTSALYIFIACGLLFPAMGQRLQIASVQHVGPALTSAIGSFTPFFATLLAVSFLGEEINAQAVAGIALLISGLVAASFARGGWRVNSTIVLLIPLGAALVRGITQPLAKLGYIEGASPFFGTLVMVSVSTAVVGTLFLAQGRSVRALVPTRGNLWFVLNGAVTVAGILGLQAALSLGAVNVTSSLIATTPLWALALGALVFRNERLGWMHAAVAGLVCIGSILIVTS